MLKLTTLERKILDHRLDVPDAIADAMAECELDLTQLGTVVSLLLNGEYDKAEELNKTLAHAVLQEAVEGSTYLGAAHGNVSDRHVYYPRG